MNNKLYGYQEHANYNGCDISKETFSEATNEILGTVTNTSHNDGNRFLYTAEPAGKFPTTANIFDTFVFDGYTFIYYKNTPTGIGFWVRLATLPFTLPPIVYPTPVSYPRSGDYIYLTYYNGGQWTFFVYYDWTTQTWPETTWQFSSGEVWTELPFLCYTLAYYIQQERKVDPQKGSLGYTYATEPIIIPIEQYNNDRLLGTVTSADISPDGITFSSETANKLNKNELLYLIPKEKNSVNLINKPVTFAPKMRSIVYYANPEIYYGTLGPRTNPYLMDTPSWYFTPNGGVAGTRIYDNVGTSLENIPLYKFNHGWPAAGMRSESEVQSGMTRGSYYSGMTRDGSSNKWMFQKGVYKQEFGALYTRAPSPNANNTSLQLYPFPFYEDPVAHKLWDIASTGSNMVFNVYKALSYKADPDGTEVILAPSRSKFQGLGRYSDAYNYLSNYNNSYGYTTTIFGGTNNYFNMVWLNNSNVDLNNNSVKGQTDEFGTLPTGTEIQIFPANQYPNSITVPVAMVFTTNLTPQQRTDCDGRNKSLGVYIQYAQIVFLLGQTDPMENGLYGVRDTAWVKYDSVDAFSYGGNWYSAPIPTLNSYWASRGETVEYFKKNIFIVGPTVEKPDENSLFIVAPPWSHRNGYAPNNGIPTYTKVVLDNELKANLRSYKVNAGYTYSPTNYGFPLFSNLPQGLESGRNYYLIKNGVNIKFANTYQDALDGIGVPLVTTGRGAMTIYTSPADENQAIIRIDDDKKSILDPSKIYYLINSKKGVQIADTKAKALSKEAIQLNILPNTYNKLIKNTETYDAPVAWDPSNTTNVELFNVTEPLLPIAGKVLSNYLLWGSGTNVNNYFGWLLRGTSIANRKKITIPAGALTGLIKGINWDSAFDVTNNPNGNLPSNYVTMQRTVINYNYYNIYDPDLPNIDPPGASWTILGVTLNETVKTPTISNAGGFTIKTFNKRLANDNAFSNAVAEALNEIIASRPIQLETVLSGFNNSGNLQYGTDAVLNSSNDVTYTKVLTTSGTYAIAVADGLLKKYYTKIGNINGHWTTVPPTFNIGVKLSITLNQATMKLSIVVSTPYCAEPITTKPIIYQGNFNNLEFVLVNGSEAVGAPQSFTAIAGSNIIPIDKDIKLTFDNNVKHIWRKISPSNENSVTLTEFNYNQPTTNILLDDLVNGVDYEESSSNFTGPVICKYKSNKNCWTSETLESNGVKFKIEIAFTDNALLYNNYYYGQWNTVFRIRSSANSSIDFPYYLSTKSVTNTYGDLTVTNTVMDNNNSSTNIILDDRYTNGYQLTILDSLYNNPKQFTAVNYKGNEIVTYDYSQVVTMPTTNLLGMNSYKGRADWGIAQSVSTNNSIASGGYQLKAIPTVKIVKNDGSPSFGTGAILEAVCKEYNVGADKFFIPQGVKVLKGGRNYFGGYQLNIPSTTLRDIVRYEGTLTDGKPFRYDQALITNYSGRTYSYFPSTPYPTDQQVFDAFYQIISPIYAAPTVGLDGVTYLNKATGPVTIKTLKKIELIDP